MSTLNSYYADYLLEKYLNEYNSSSYELSELIEELIEKLGNKVHLLYKYIETTIMLLEKISLEKIKRITNNFINNLIIDVKILNKNKNASDIVNTVEKSLKKIPENSVIVMDNASFHSKLNLFDLASGS